MKSASFLLTPLREGRRSKPSPAARPRKYFYSRPCGRGDLAVCGGRGMERLFLLTPLREGRLPQLDAAGEIGIISTHAPAGGATQDYHRYPRHRPISTHAPAGGATRISTASNCWSTYFYSRPCGRGDTTSCSETAGRINFYSRPCGRGDSMTSDLEATRMPISTHAPAGGATFGLPALPQL